MAFALRVLKVWALLSSRRKVHVVFLFILMSFSGLSDGLTIGAVFPLLAILTDPQKVLDNQLALNFISYFSIVDAQALSLYATLMFIVLVIFSGCVRLALTWGLIRLSLAIGAELGTKALRNILHQPYDFHLNANSGQLVTIVGKATALGANVVQPVLTIFACFVTMVLVVSTLFLVDSLISMMVLACFGFLYLLTVIASKKFVQKNSKIASDQKGKTIVALQESFGGVRDVILDGSQDHCCDRYNYALTSMQRAAALNQIIATSPRFVIESAAMAMLAATAYIIIIVIPDNASLSLPALGVIAVTAQKLLPVLQQLYQAYCTLRGHEASVTEALEFLGLRIKLPSNDPIRVNSMVFNKCISVQGVGFRYRGEESWTLRNISLEILKGERIALVGESGSGKTTLLNIVMGLLSPTTGSISVDGTIIDDDNRQEYRRSIAHVPQDIYLIDATVEQNIALGYPPEDIDFERVRHAAEMANASEFIICLHDGYKTMVGERGVRLSGGQRQRIGIARALYRSASLIILDEATSALDTTTELSVLESLDRLDNRVSLLIVSHRPSFLKGCSRVFRLSAGSLMLDNVRRTNFVRQVHGKDN